MARLPIVTPYAQTIPAVMNYLLARTYPRFQIAADQMQYVDSIIDDPARPERAEARYRHIAKPDGALNQFSYTRLNLDRYADLYTLNWRYLAVGNAVPADETLFDYVLTHFQVLLTGEDAIVEFAPELDETNALSIIIRPNTDHPIWFGALRLWAVPTDDIRALVTKLVHHTIDPTHPTA